MIDVRTFSPPDLIYDFSAEGGAAIAGECVTWPGGLTPDRVCPLAYQYFGQKGPIQLFLVRHP